MASVRGLISAIAAALVVGVVASSAAAKPSLDDGGTATITGKYRTRITTPADAAGTWTLNFKKNGTGTTTWNGQMLPFTFTFRGSTLTDPGGAGRVCPTAGTYRIHLAGTHLTLTVIHDPCKLGRAQVFPGHIWTKVG